MAADLSKLDPGGVIKDVHNEALEALRVDIVGGTLSIDASTDSVAIKDGANQLNVNADGSLNVVVDGVVGELYLSEYGEISSVAASLESTILTYTVPAGKSVYLHRVEMSGTNVAQYKIKIDSVINDRKYTHFCDLNTKSEYSDGSKKGYKLTEGQVLTVTVLHTRPTVGDFNARMIGIRFNN